MFQLRTTFISKAARRNREQGFSIIEIAVVLLIIALIAAFTIPQVVNYLKRYRLTASSRNVATALQRARYLATSNNRRAGVNIPDLQRLDIEEYDPEGKQPPQQRGMINLPSGVLIAPDAPRQIAFDGRGIVTPLPTENPKIRVNGESGYYQIVTVATTGQVTVSAMNRDE